MRVQGRLQKKKQLKGPVLYTFSNLHWFHLMKRLYLNNSMALLKTGCWALCLQPPIAKRFSLCWTVPMIGRGWKQGRLREQSQHLTGDLGTNYKYPLWHHKRLTSFSTQTSKEILGNSLVKDIHYFLIWENIGSLHNMGPLNDLQNLVIHMCSQKKKSLCQSLV